MQQETDIDREAKRQREERWRRRRGYRRCRGCIQAIQDHSQLPLDQHTTTEHEAAELKAYFDDNQEQLNREHNRVRRPVHCVLMTQRRACRGGHDVAHHVIPETIQQTYGGVEYLPLHLAAQHQQGKHALTIILALFEAYPVGASERQLIMAPFHSMK